MATAQRLHVQRLFRSIEKAIESLGTTPAEAVWTIFYTWSSRAYPQLSTGQTDQLSPELALHPATIAFVEFLMSLDFADAAYWLSSSYAHLAGHRYRKSFSLYFTPPALVGRLLDELEELGVDFHESSFFDPACGGAAFLAPIGIRVLQKLRSAGLGAHEIIDHFEQKLMGQDIDPTLCKLSMYFLRIVLVQEIVQTGRLPNLAIIEGDALVHGLLRPTADVVVCNPPYRKLSRCETDRYREDFREVIEAQPNIYGLFIALCTGLTRPDGVSALVTPTSFLSGQNFSKLRRYISNRSRIESLQVVSKRKGVFIGVEQEAALMILRPRASNDEHQKAEVSSVDPNGQKTVFGYCGIPATGTAWPIARRKDDIDLLARTTTRFGTLQDYGYKVRVGAFVWNRDKRPVFLSGEDVPAESRLTAVPLLWSSDIEPQHQLHFDGSAKVNSEPCFVDLGDLNHKSIVRRPAILLQRVTSNDQPRRLVAAVVPPDIYDFYGGFVGENHTAILEQSVDCPPLDPSSMAALISHELIDRYFRCISGATNVSSYELQQLRLPPVDLLLRLMSQGYKLNEAVTTAWSSAELTHELDTPIGIPA